MREFQFFTNDLWESLSFPQKVSYVTFCAFNYFRAKNYVDPLFCCGNIEGQTNSPKTHIQIYRYWLTVLLIRGMKIYLPNEDKKNYLNQSPFQRSLVTNTSVTNTRILYIQANKEEIMRT